MADDLPTVRDYTHTPGCPAHTNPKGECRCSRVHVDTGSDRLHQADHCWCALGRPHAPRYLHALRCPAYTDPQRDCICSQLPMVERLPPGVYLSWSEAGGPNQCEHGYAFGIPCPRCDKNPIVIALRAERAELQGQIRNLLEQLTLDATQVIAATSAITQYARSTEKAYQANLAALEAAHTEIERLRTQIERTHNSTEQGTKEREYG